METANKIRKDSGGASAERTSEFATLLGQLEDGCPDAAERLVELYSESILRAVRRALPAAIRPKVDSVDIFQSVWASVLVRRGRLGEFDSPERLLGYLVAAARLKVLEKYRRFTRRAGFDVHREVGMNDPVDCEGAKPGRQTTPGAVLTDVRHPGATAVAEAREAWSRLVAASDQRGRQIMQMRISGMTYEHIADQLNISARTVRRAMNKLLETVEE